MQKWEFGVSSLFSTFWSKIQAKLLQVSISKSCMSIWCSHTINFALCFRFICFLGDFHVGWIHWHSSLGENFSILSSFWSLILIISSIEMVLEHFLLNAWVQISPQTSGGKLGFQKFQSLIFHPFYLCLLSSQHQAAQIWQFLYSHCRSIALGGRVWIVMCRIWCPGTWCVRGEKVRSIWNWISFELHMLLLYY